MLLPLKLRSTISTAWAKVMFVGFKSLHVSKQTWRATQRYRAIHNAQVVYLEKALNEYFQIVGYDPSDHTGTRKIYIDAGEQLDQQYIYLQTDLQPLFISGVDDVFIYSRAEHDAYFAHFIVKVPDTLVFEQAELISQVQLYINTRNFKIKTYTP